MNQIIQENLDMPILAGMSHFLTRASGITVAFNG